MSSDLGLDARRRTYVRLIGEIEKALHAALAEEHLLRNLTQQDMANLLQKSKSFVSRKMNGTSNMTLETLADLAFALDRVVKIQLKSRHIPNANHPSSNEGQSSYSSLFDEFRPKSSDTGGAANIQVRPPTPELEVVS